MEQQSKAQIVLSYKKGICTVVQNVCNTALNNLKAAQSKHRTRSQELLRSIPRSTTGSCGFGPIV